LSLISLFFCFEEKKKWVSAHFFCLLKFNVIIIRKKDEKSIKESLKRKK